MNGKIVKLSLALFLTAALLGGQACRTEDASCLAEDPVCNAWLLLLEAPAVVGEASSYLYHFDDHGLRTFSIDADTGGLNELNELGFSLDETPFSATNPGGEFMYAIYETGEYNMIYQYRVGSDGIPTLNGYTQYPETVISMAVSPGGETIYGLSQDIDSPFLSFIAISIDLADGGFTQTASETLSFGMDADRGSDQVVVHPDGEFVYNGTNGRKENIQGRTLSADGVLSDLPGTDYTSFAETVKVAMHPGGTFLASVGKDNDNVSTWLSISAINNDVGSLQELSVLEVLTEDSVEDIYLQFHPNGKYLYAAISGITNQYLKVYSIDESTGELTELSGSPLLLDQAPTDLLVDESGSNLYLPLYGDTSKIELYRIGSDGVPVLATDLTFFLDDNGHAGSLEMKVK